MPIVVTCECGLHYEAADWLAGRIVPCLKCCYPLIVAAEPNKVLDLTPYKLSRLARFRCRCGKRLKASRKLLGTWVSCTRCGELVLVQNNRIKSTRRGNVSLDPRMEDSASGLRDLDQSDGTMPASSMVASNAFSSWDDQEAHSSAKCTKPYELSSAAMRAVIGGWVGAIMVLLAGFFVPALFEAENVEFGGGMAGLEFSASTLQKITKQTPKIPEIANPSVENFTDEKSASSWNPFLGWTGTSGALPKASWISYQSASGGFKIDFPGVPEANPAPQPLGTIGVQEFSATLVLQGPFLFEAKRVRTSSVIPNLTDRTQQNREEMRLTRAVDKWKVVSQRELSVQGTPGYEERFLFQKADGHYTVIGRAFRKKGHQFILHCEAPVGKFDEATASRFLESFTITSRE